MAERTIAGRYELLEPLGSGWRARDTELERDVFVRLGAAAEGGAPTLAHPSIARIFDQGEADGERYDVSEYLPGGSLAEKSDLSEDEALAVAAAGAAALAYAHGQGVTHGALTPAKVLFDSEGRAKVAGFGAAGDPEDDVRAFGAILESLSSAAPSLAPVAAAALAGELGSAELLQRIPRVERTPPVAEEATQIRQQPVPEPSRRGPNALIAIAAAAALAGGLLAAFVATSGDDPNTADPTTGSLSVPIPTGSTESTTAQTNEAPPTTETSETTTTEQTTSATTEPQAEPSPTTTRPPVTTTAPSPTTAPPPTTEPPPATTTEAPPPTTTETTPATTAAG
jgi:serine/threonine protein kinase